MNRRQNVQRSALAAKAAANACSIRGQVVDLTFDTLSDAQAARDSKRAASALDPDFKRVMESRVRKTEAAKSNLEWLLDRYLIEISPRKKSAKTDQYRIGKLKK